MSEIGIIFHFGLYSIYGFDSVKSANKRKIKNGSEWFLKRLYPGTYRPVSGYKETQEYFESEFKTMGYKDYFDAEADFNEIWSDETIATEYITNWIELVKTIGATYVILTTKHHDGFCLFETNTTVHKSKVDIIKIFVNCARQYGLKVGLYYSWMEFLEKPTISYIDKKVKPQMLELMNYNVDRWFFDGGWEMKTKYALNTMANICQTIKENGGEINDRLGNDELYKDPNYLGYSTYRTYADREIPEIAPEVPWEHINTIGLSWGINRYQKSENYKTGRQLYNLYREVSEKSGNFLINLGPDFDGSLDIYEVEALKEFAKLI